MRGYPDGVILARAAAVIAALGLSSPGTLATSSPDPPAVPPSTPPRQRLVVASFDEQGVPAGMGDVVSDMLIRAIDSPAVELLERRQIRRLLEEQALAGSDLTQPGDAVRYGRLADSRFVLVGTVYRIDGDYIVSARMVDSATGVVQESARAVVQFRTVDGMASQVAELARALGLRVGPPLPSDPVAVVAPGPKPSGESAQPGDPREGGAQPLQPQPAPQSTSTVRDYLEQVGDTSIPSVKVAAPGNVRTVREGDEIRFSVRSERDGFLSLFVVDSRGRIGVLLPNDRAGSMPVRSGQSVSVPRDVAFALRASAPYGPTRIKAIVTAQPVSLEAASDPREVLRRVTPDSSIQGTGGSAVQGGWSSAELEFLVAPAHGTGAAAHPDRLNSAPVRSEPQPPNAGQAPAGADGAGDRPVLSGEARRAISRAFERSLGSAAEPGTSESAMLRWPLHSPFVPQIDLMWRPGPPEGASPPSIAVIDADFDPDDPFLRGAFARMRPSDRDALRAEIRRNGHASFRHGNRVASIIAGEAPWLPSVMPGAPVVPIRITTSMDAPAYRADRGGFRELLEALRASIGAGCRVVNLSLSVPLSGPELQAFADDPVWDELERAEVVVVCAAGNGREDLDANPRYPACLERPNILCVGAVGPDGQIAVWGEQGSARGRHSVDVFAPGSLITVSDGSGRAGLADGTSYACAFAAGAVARLMADEPEIRAADAVARILATAQPVPNLDGHSRAGLLRWPVKR